MKNRLKNFTIVSNIVLNDENISLKAKGLYAFLCSKPDDWDFNYKGLRSQLKEGEKAIRTACRELVTAKVLTRKSFINTRNGKSFNDYEWILNPTNEDLEKTIDPFNKKRGTQKGHSQKGGIQKGGAQKGHNQKGDDIVKTNHTNTNYTNTKTNKKEKEGPIKENAKKVIGYLNKKLNSKFRNSETHTKYIEARLKEKYTIADLKTVIDKKCDQWLDTKMSSFLRPQTLFSKSKFDGYLNEIVKKRMSKAERDYLDSLEGYGKTKLKKIVCV